jgi:enoyl-CoA hydratase
MLRELDAGLDEVAADPSVRALLVTGAGRAFSAGGDLKAYIALQRDPVAFPAFVADVHRVFGRLRALRVPAIALVNGVAVAGGLELLLNCDLAFAAESASIGDGHLNFGQMGGGGSLTLLPRLVGLQRACELIFTGKLLTATEAESWGLVSRCVADDALLDTGLSFAQEVARKSPLAIANAKHVVNAIWADALALEPGLRFERERNAFFCLTSEDAPEGLSAFSEKRRPQFKGR